MLRRQLILGTGAAAALALTNSTRAQESWPSRPIRMVVPYPPGGNVDKIARYVVDRIGAALGQRMFIDNRPGAQTVIGLEYAMRAAPDGYTLVAGANTSLNILPHIRQVPYSAFESFEAVAQLGVFLSMMAVPTDSPVTTVREFVAYAKARPGKLSYGSVGQGSFANLAMEGLKYGFGLDILHVPYRGTADLVTAALSKQIDIVIEPQILPHVKSGRMRAIAA